MIGKITADIAIAMKAQDKERLNVLRSLKTALMNRKIEIGKDIDFDEFKSILRKEIKSRQQAIELYEKGNRPDLASVETKEIDIIQEYLPAMLSRDQIENEVLKAVAELNVESLKDMGRIMSHLKTKIGDVADGKTLSDIVK